MTIDPPFQGTYPSDEDFWVPTPDDSEYPPRYGDLFATPENESVRDTKGRPWRAVMALHPSCEMGAKPAPDGVQVVRVYLLREVSQAQREEVRAGFRETSLGIRPVRVNIVYLAPPRAGPLTEELFADLRKTARVPIDEIQAAGRLAAMTHDARLAVLRRDIYFRYRWDFPVSELLRLEQGRISADSAFQGPRPPWAPPAPTTAS